MQARQGLCPKRACVVRARVLVPRTLQYPWSAVDAGLRRAGVETTDRGDEDILVTWSPWAQTPRAHAEREFRAAGKPVICCENGWLSPIQGMPYYQLGLDGWNGTGRFPPGDDRRWGSWGLRLRPWRLRTSGNALIIGQRGHPWDARTMPPRWLDEFTPDCGRPVIRRPRDATRPLAADLEDADVVHTWSSNAASWAVVAGVPVVQHGPNLMVSALASAPGALCRYTGPREPVLERLAWAQWSEEEISSGEPFRRLLEAA